MVEHCSDLSGDRNLGKFWEQQFGLLAQVVGKSYSFLQIGNSQAAIAFQLKEDIFKKFTLPDVIIWTSPGEFHEVKHKAPTFRGSFGLEAYRFDALLWLAKETNQRVMYTIHNHALSGGREAKLNNLAHWLTANILDLEERQSYTSNSSSYMNSATGTTKIHFWPAGLWQPLKSYWNISYPIVINDSKLIVPRRKSFQVRI